MSDKEVPLTEEEELAILFPEPVPFKIGNLTVKLIPMDTDTCMRFMHKARPLLKQLMQEGPLQMSDKMIPAVTLAVADHPTEAKEALAIATGRSAEFIGKLPPSAVGALVVAIVQVNADFFVRSVGSLASGAAMATPGEKTGANDGAGLTH
jgi:hypothetical protein